MFEILGILVLIQAMFFLFLGYLKVGRINNPITYFNIWWGIWFFLSLQGLFGLDKLNFYTFLIIYLSNFALSLGLLVTIKRKNTTKIKNDNINWRIINIIQIVLTIILLFYFFRTISILNSTGLGSGDFRNFYIYGTNNIFGNPTVRFLFINLIKALITAFFLLSISSILINKRNKVRKIGLIVSSINLILYSGVMMGRIEIFRLIVLYILSIIIYKTISKSNHKIVNMKLKIKKRYIIILAILLVSFTYIRDINNSFWSSVSHALEQFFIYFIGPFIAFDKFVSNFNTHHFELGWGRGFLGGLEQILHNFVGLFFKNSESYATYLSRYTDSRIFIGENQTFNALYTMYFNFYADGRIFATILCALITGLVIGIIFSYSNRNISIYSFAVYLYFAHILIFGSIFWPLDGLGDWMVLIFIMFIYVFAEKIIFKKSKTQYH